MSARLIQYDRFTGLGTALIQGEGDGKIRLHYTEDVEPVLERNKALQNDSRRYERQKKAGFVHVASIPATIQIEWKEKYGVDIHDKNATMQIRRLLNLPEYKYLRTTSKRI